VFEDGIENLKSGDYPAGTINEVRAGAAELAQEIGGEFHARLGVFHSLPVFEIILVTALDPIGQMLGAETLTGFAQFAGEDAIGQAVFEHDLRHISVR